MHYSQKIGVFVLLLMTTYVSSTPCVVKRELKAHLNIPVSPDNLGGKSAFACLIYQSQQSEVQQEIEQQQILPKGNSSKSSVVFEDVDQLLSHYQGEYYSRSPAISIHIVNQQFLI